MSIHIHDWKPRSDIGCGKYSCECSAIGSRSWATGRIVVQPFERAVPEPTVGFKAQPRQFERDGSADTGRPRKVHRQAAEPFDVGRGRAFQPSLSYRRVCIAMLELGADRPLQTVADMAGVSVAFVRKVQAHVMADDYAQNE